MRFSALRARLAGLTLVWLALAVSAAEPVTLNLKDADILALVELVADATGKNFIVDPRVKGTVNVISPRPLNNDALYQVFLSVLKVNGFVAVPSGDMIKILPDISGRTEAAFGATSPPQGDVPTTRVIKVENVPAAALVPVLRPLLSKDAHLAAAPASNTLIISDAAANVARLTEIVRRMDLPATGDVETVTLQYATATEVVRVLEALQKDTAGGEGGKARGAFVADERSNSVLIGGGRDTRLALRAVIANLDTPQADRSGNIHVVYLRYANAEELQAVIEGVINALQKVPAAQGQTDPSGGAPPGQATVQSDPGTNALIVSAPPSLWSSIESVVQKLDIPRAQVLVEAVVVEVSSTLARELGVQWRGTAGYDNNRGVLGGTNFDNTQAGANRSNLNPFGGLGDGLNLGFLDGTRSILGTNITMGVLVRALEADTGSNVLSTPSLVTLDNQEAEILVGQNVPFVTGAYTTPGNVDNAPFQTIQREDIGVKLKVKPQINQDGTVRLQIAQEVSSISDSAAGSDIITNKRAITTTAVVQDQQLVVLGGLMDRSLLRSDSRVPVLGSIPVIGGLFRYKSTTGGKTNLMVFIRPRVLRDAEVTASVTGDKYETLRRLQRLDAQDRELLAPPGAAPVLPALEEMMRGATGATPPGP